MVLSPSSFYSIRRILPSPISWISLWRFRQRKLYLEHHLPWAINTGIGTKFLLGIYFEERWEQPLADFYQETNIIPLVPIETISNEI